MGINEPSQEIANWLPRWKLVRDVVSGQYEIKRGGETYLPRVRTGQSNEEYARFLKATPFFPATARTAQGLLGLWFAKNVVLNAPVLDAIMDVITKDGMSWRDLAKDVCWETVQTNRTGLLIDHPNAPIGADLNAENALAQGLRPFIHVFPGETILRIDYGIVRNRQLPIRVCLQESCERILELKLTNEIYTQTVWTLKDGAWAEGVTTTPVRLGKPLNEIPFVIVSDNTKTKPQPCVLEDLCQLNLSHYIAQGRISALETYGAGVIPVITGITPEKDGNGKDIIPELFFGPGGFLILPDHQAKAFFLEPDGNMSAALNTSKKDLEEQMAKVGARMLAPERVAPEAEATVRMRSAAEDSTNASLAIVYARRLSEAFGWCAWWMGGERTDATLTLNTDYANKGLTAQERTIALAELQAGYRSREDWFYERRDAGIINSSLTFEEEQDRIAADVIDQPTAEL